MSGYHRFTLILAMSILICGGIGRDLNRKASKFYQTEVETLKNAGHEKVKVGTVKVANKAYELYEWVKSKT